MSLCLKFFPCASLSGSTRFFYVQPLLLSTLPKKVDLEMLQEFWGTLVLLIPVFLLLAMMFGAGFFIGRISKKSER
jgi:hypothetical protein